MFIGACGMSHLKGRPTRTVRLVPSHENEAHRYECDRCKVECSAVGRSGTACRVPTEASRQEPCVTYRGVRRLRDAIDIGAQAEAYATERLDYFGFLDASFLMTAPFFITKFILRMDSMSSRGLEGMATMSA